MIVLLSDPRIATIPVRESREPLVDLRTVAPLLVDSRQADPAGAYAHVRAGIVDRLVAAQSLLTRNVRLLIIEGYRPLVLQQQYFAEYTRRLRANHPEWPAGKVHDEASRYIAPPEVAPHVAGAAVDLTLADANGTELPMGSVVNADPAGSNGTCYTDAPGLPAHVRANRRILSDALTAVGFVNYPTEWWHWSHGDRYWCFVTAHEAARYGPLAGPGPG